MKTFEEKFTAWVDGELKGQELAEFEAGLDNALDARLAKLAARQVGDLCREHGRAPELKNEDFFNLQIMQRIEAESPVPAATPARRKFAWSLPRLAMAGAFSLLVAFGLYHTMIPPQKTQPAAQEARGSFEVISNKGVDTIYYSQQNDVNVVLIGESGMSPEPVKHPSPEKRKDK